ncbi:MAG TPA: ElyC/SanA/YdcF family protein [Syntrophorhabdales bacterium]|nr:ElyC/SanA/YdcF family protein [Syntrophorhabdales bacterium]
MPFLLLTRVKVKRATLVFFAVLVIAALYLAPCYLVFSQTPEKSDAVILLVGVKDEARYREAVQLIREGYAEYLVIPALNKVMRALPDRSLTKALPVPLPPAGAYKTGGETENTHLEIAQARRIMATMGFTSAIFVSSPYHMRRIKLIASRVFSGTANTPTFRLYFVPTRYETHRLCCWFLKTRDLKFVSSEYAKMSWFLIYTCFPGP